MKEKKEKRSKNTEENLADMGDNVKKKNKQPPNIHIMRILEGKKKEKGTKYI